MGEHHARVVAPPLPESATVAIAEPALAGGAGASLTQWAAARSRAGDTLLVGCVSTPIPGWVDDMRPTVDARTTALMTASAERAAGGPLEVRPRGEHLELRHGGRGEDAPRAGLARTFVGWEDAAVVTCFAACTTARAQAVAAAAADEATGGPCDAVVMNARLEGSTTPPAPGVLLGAVTWGVHHPTTTIAWGGVLAFTLGVVAVVSRRRPRSRI